jgi:NADH dehydrogenase/NADH:ubiquinone oxidoreductase subunit G
LEEDKKYFSYIVYDNGKSKVVFKRGREMELNESLTIDEIAQVHGISDLESKKQNSEFYSDDFVLWLLDKIKNDEKFFFENLWDLNDIKSLNWKKSLINAPIKFNIDEISNKKLKKLQQFIKGDFLEEYIFALLKEIKEELKIFDIAWNVKKGKEANFEVDVVASKNNNLYLFSCTTDKTKKIVKQKGFEAKERVTQMGGKNAKAVLVSCIDLLQKNQLEEDLRENKGGESPEVIVYEDLLDKEQLKNKLKDIFK